MRKLLLLGAALACLVSNVRAQDLVTNVTAYPQWTDTGLTVTNGQIVTVNTLGTWSFDNNGVTTPDGVNFERSNAEYGALFLDNTLISSVVAFIGSGTNDPGQGHMEETNFFPQPLAAGYWSIGSAGQFIADRTGRLFLLINDDAGKEGTVAEGGTGANHTDNSGSVTCQIFIGPGKSSENDIITISEPIRSENSFRCSLSSDDTVSPWFAFASADLTNWVFLQQFTFTNVSSVGSNTFFNYSGVPYRFYKFTDGTHTTTVGYTEVTVPATNWALIADQLIDRSGSNRFDTVLTNVPNGTIVEKWDEGNQSFITNIFSSGIWTDPGMTVNPGEGIAIYNPTATAITIAFTGRVPEGNLVNPVPNGLSLRSSIIPQAGPIGSYLAYPVTNFDDIKQGRVVPWGGGYYFQYKDNDYFFGEWEGSDGGAEPIASVGEAFWIYNGASAKNWTRDFSVWRSPSP